MRSHVAISRRSFVEKLGLGIGATLLSPIAQSLVSQAEGQVPGTKRFVVWLGHQGIRPRCITPPELQTPDDRELSKPMLPGATGWTIPPMVKALEAHRDRMLLLDGFNNNMPRLQHTATWGALSCLSALNGGSNEGGGSPGGVTIDQFAATKLGASTKFKSVLWGTGKSGGSTGNNIFASGAGRPEAHFRSPALMFRTIFGGLTLPPSGGGPVVDRGAIRRRLLFDELRFDVGKLQANLAGDERRKLDHYLAVIEDFEKRQKLAPPLLSSCKVPAMPTTDPTAGGKTTMEDWLEVMNDMSIVALVCGVTNVVGAAANNGGVHSNQGYDRIKAAAGLAKLDGAGHGPDTEQVPQMNLIHNFHAGLVARFVETLKAIPEGNGTAFDNALIVYTTDNGDHHHSDNWRWPMVVVGNAGGKLRADGRYLRYASRTRSCRDFWATMAEAVGVPSDTYGTPGNLQKIQGPLTEILV